MSEVAVVFCDAFVLHGVGPPVSSSEGRSAFACLSASSSLYGHSMCLGQAIVRLGLCMFDVGGMWTSSFGRFTPHLCLIPSMHGSCTRCLFAGWFAHELVFSGLSWPTLDKPFWLDVGNNSLSLSYNSNACHSLRVRGGKAAPTYNLIGEIGEIWSPS